MWSILRRLLAWLRSGRSGGAPDPYARRTAPLKPRPMIRAGGAAVAEPEDDFRENAVAAVTRASYERRKAPIDV